MHYRLSSESSNAGRRSENGHAHADRSLSRWKRSLTASKPLSERASCRVETMSSVPPCALATLCENIILIPGPEAGAKGPAGEKGWKILSSTVAGIGLPELATYGSNISSLFRYRNHGDSGLRKSWCKIEGHPASGGHAASAGGTVRHSVALQHDRRCATVLSSAAKGCAQRCSLALPNQPLETIANGEPMDKEESVHEPMVERREQDSQSGAGPSQGGGDKATVDASQANGPLLDRRLANPHQTQARSVRAPWLGSTLRSDDVFRYMAE